jgi:hypothetical protein
LVRSEGRDTAPTYAGETLLPRAALPARGDRRTMDKSIQQARWLLGPLFGLCFGVAFVGVLLG